MNSKSIYQPIQFSDEKDKNSAWEASILQVPKVQENLGSHSNNGDGSSLQALNNLQEKRQLSVYTGTLKSDIKKVPISSPHQSQHVNEEIPRLYLQESELLSFDPSIKKIPFTIRDMASGRMIICLLEPLLTILDLKNRISQQEGFQVIQMKITMLKKEISDDTLLQDFVEDMQVRCFELILRPAEAVSGSFSELRGSNLRLR